MRTGPLNAPTYKLIPFTDAMFWREIGVTSIQADNPGEPIMHALHNAICKREKNLWDEKMFTEE
jgi:hypothetical protein